MVNRRVAVPNAACGRSWLTPGTDRAGAKCSLCAAEKPLCFKRNPSRSTADVFANLELSERHNVQAPPVPLAL